MASLKDLRNRIASVKATQKITKAMQMVAAAKLRRAQSAAEAARPYAQRMAQVLGNLAAGIVPGPETPRLVYNVGRIFAQISPGRAEHHERAMQLVQRALTLTPSDQRAAFWKQYVLSDPAMVPLRNSVGFNRLRDSQVERR